jgi:hypothetical protein
MAIIKPCVKLCSSAVLIVVSVVWLGSRAAGDEKGNFAKIEPIGPPAALTVNRILEWLPANTETLIVARGPYQVEAVDPDQVKDAPLAKLLKMWPMSLLTIREGVFQKLLVGQSVSLAVEGSRRFRGPKELGMMPYEGCQIISFRQNLGPAGDRFMDALRKTSKAQQIEGIEVIAFDEKMEKDIWHILFARPSPEVLLCATDVSYLAEVFRRMRQREEPRALPPDLREWRQVDTHARFWAIRHFKRPVGMLRDLTSPFHPIGAGGPNQPDEDAIGLTFSFDSGDTAHIKYLSRNKHALQLTRKGWGNLSSVGLPAPKIHEAAPGVVEVTIDVKAEGASRGFLFILLAALGHGICV